MRRTPFDEVAIQQVPGVDKRIARAANLDERIPAVLRVLGIPAAHPDTTDEAAGTRPGAHERISLSSAQLKRAVHCFQTALGTNPRQGIGYVNERTHFYIDQAIVSCSSP